MSYDAPHTQVYEFGASNEVALQFGAAGETVAYEFKSPTTKKGLVRDIEIEVTEAMVGTTTVPEVNVGAAATVAATPSVDYARFRLGTAAGTGYATTVNTIRARDEVGGQLQAVGRPLLSDFAGHIDLETDYIPADALFYISFREGVDGTETGAGRVKVYIDWF